jgi:outer membrane lipoprotein-sorting protein
MHKSEPDYEIVERATQALRNAPVPEGPPPQLIEATINALNDPTTIAASNRTSRLRRFVHSYRLAASIAVVVGCGVLLAMLLPHGASEPVALGAIIEHLKTAQTVQFTETTETDEVPHQRSSRAFMKGNRLRSECDDSVSILDATTRQILILVPSTKTAIIPSVQGTPGGGSVSPANALLMQLTRLQDQPGSYRGVQTVNGRRLFEYRTMQFGEQFAILADAETQLPVEVTRLTPLTHAKSTLRDFVFDADLSDDLFSFTPPTGYTLQKPGDSGKVWVTTAPDGTKTRHAVASQVSTVVIKVRKGEKPDVDFSEATEQDVVNYLRILAETNNRLFPPRDRFGDRRPHRSPSDDHAIAFKWFRCRTYLMDQKALRDALYIGQGTKLGDSSRPVLVWTVENGMKGKVVYGDLRIQEYATPTLEWLAVLAYCKMQPAETRPQ